MSKYSALQKYLESISESQREITLTFKRIEELVGSKLPGSAFQYQQWWDKEKEGNHVEARSWLNAGWKVETVNFSEGWVRFFRFLLTKD